MQDLDEQPALFISKIPRCFLPDHVQHIDGPLRSAEIALD